MRFASTGPRSEVEQLFRWLLEKRTYDSDAYLTHLDDQGGNLSAYGYDVFARIKNHSVEELRGDATALATDLH